MKIFTLLLLSFCFCHSQEAQYEIAHKNKKLGTLTVTQTQNDDETIIQISSFVRVKLILHIDLKYNLISVYKKGVLTSSKVKTYANDKLHSSMIIKKEKDGYHITENGKTSIYNEAICYSGAMLYFYEPKDIYKMFSEIDGYKTTVKKENEHTYQIIHPGKSHGNEYIYENGLLKKTVIHHPLLSFSIIKM